MNKDNKMHAIFLAFILFGGCYNTVNAMNNDEKEVMNKDRDYYFSTEEQKEEEKKLETILICLYRCALHDFKDFSNLRKEEKSQESQDGNVNISSYNDSSRAWRDIFHLCFCLGMDDKTESEFIDNKVNRFQDILVMAKCRFEGSKTKLILTKDTLDDILKPISLWLGKDKIFKDNKDIMGSFIDDLKEEVKRNAKDKNPMAKLIKARHMLFMNCKIIDDNKIKIKKNDDLIKSGNNRIEEYNQKLKKDPNNESAISKINEVKKNIEKINVDNKNLIKECKIIENDIEENKEYIETLDC